MSPSGISLRGPDFKRTPGGGREHCTAPVGIRRATVFVPDPPDQISAPGRSLEEHCVRLVPFEHEADLVGDPSRGIGNNPPVKPYLGQTPVSAPEFRELIQDHPVVRLPFVRPPDPVGEGPEKRVQVRVVIEAGPHSVRPARSDEITDNIPRPVPPRCVPHVVAVRARRPETEPGAVLGDEDGVRRAGVLCRGDPLVGVQFRRPEQRERGERCAPGILKRRGGEHVDIEVDDDADLAVRPADLLPGREDRLFPSAAITGSDENRRSCKEDA